MRPSERRAIELQKKADAGDPRAVLMLNTPPNQRSEVAARYDHMSECADLDSGRGPTADELDNLRNTLHRYDVAIALDQRGGYRGLSMRYLTGGLISEGAHRRVSEIEAETPQPTDADVLETWTKNRERDRVYLRIRYGL